MRQLEVGEGDVGGAEATSERGGVVGLRVGDVLVGDLSLPVVVGNLGLENAVLRQVCVRPGSGAVAV